MPKYAFVLGKNPELSYAEIEAVFPDGKIVAAIKAFLILELPNQIEAQAVLNRLGGTIKIAEVLETNISPEVIADNIKMDSRLRGNDNVGDDSKKSGKINFGVSFYESKPTRLGFEVKKILKQAGLSSRLVVSREATLSSVIVKKEHVTEFLILQNKWLAKTLAVQDFEDYGRRDYGRPAADAKSGMLPPKVAQIMINLAQQPLTATILDPFCGSGTVLQEALVMGYEKVIGSDVSEKAVADSKENLDWLTATYKLPAMRYQVAVADVRDLSEKINDQVDAVVSEPYLGPPLRGRESPQQIKHIIDELTELYRGAFATFAKLVRPGGRVVMIVPYFVAVEKSLPVDAIANAAKFSRIDISDLFYSRPDQHVQRQIMIWTKK